MATAELSTEHCDIACPSCDLIFNIPDLRDGETARCSRCGHFLTTYKADELDRLMAYSTAALMLMAMACSFPFMQFSRSGLESEMTLPQTAIALWNNGMPDLAFMVAAFIMLIPALTLLLILLLAATLKSERSATWLPELGRVVFSLQAWSMVEVFLVGVLVSLVKIAKMATIVLGISFWSYIAFAIMFTLTLTNLDRVQCWERIEALMKP